MSDDLEAVREGSCVNVYYKGDMVGSFSETDGDAILYQPDENGPAARINIE